MDTSSPLTSIILFLLVLPFWVRGVQKLREKLNARNVPIVALFAAFSFVIMMFNVPLPGGTTGHAVGGALAAIILGPEIATISITIALIIQAFFFGDGGILAIGANAFNMAVVLPYVTYAIYRVIASNPKRQVIAAALSGWAGLTAAAFFTAVEFGIQPVFWHTANGTPLYAPYPLSISIPAMVVPHLLVASVIEGLVTALVVSYLLRANPAALRIVQQEDPAASGFGGLARWRALWVGLAALILITPIGLLAPGTAWGEWGAKELTSLGLAVIPQGLAQLSGLWSAPISNYQVHSFGSASLGYIFSAAIGVTITIIVVWLFSLLITRGKKSPESIRRP